MNQGIYFTVSPMNQQINLVAGETFHGSVKVVNTASDGVFYYNVDLLPYNVSDGNYVADFATISNRAEILKWIDIEQTAGILEPGEAREINYTINVPEDAPGGGQYAVLSVGSNEPTKNNDGFMIQNVFHVGSLIYAEVEGEIVHAGEIVSNSIPGFSFTNPPVISAVVSNNGNTHETARVVLRVKDFISSEMVYPKEGESDGVEEIILPDTTRTISREISGLNSLGVYEIAQVVTYLGKTTTTRQVLVICPLWFLILVILTISAVITLIVRAIIKHKKRRSMVI